MSTQYFHRSPILGTMQAPCTEWMGHTLTDTIVCGEELYGVERVHEAWFHFFDQPGHLLQAQVEMNFGICDGGPGDSLSLTVMARVTRGNVVVQDWFPGDGALFMTRSWPDEISIPHTVYSLGGPVPSIGWVPSPCPYAIEMRVQLVIQSESPSPRYARGFYNLAVTREGVNCPL